QPPVPGGNNGTAAAMTSPAPGSMLNSSSVMFNWNTGSNVTSYSLSVGTAVDGTDLGTFSGSATSKTITTIPQNGHTAFVKLGSQNHPPWRPNPHPSPPPNNPPPPPPPPGGSASCGNMNVGQGASLNGFIPFSGTNSAWNQDISAAPVDTNSSAIINYIGSTIGIHPDFGVSGGIPYVIVDGQVQQKVPISISSSTESDPGPMPVPTNAPIEGAPNPVGDKHVLVIDSKNCWLYELYNSTANNDGSWSVESAAIWDLTANVQRPYTWTSADAAGLPILPGLVRYDEVSSGAINHALRFTVPNTRKAYVWPARHYASSSTDPTRPPMGQRFRLTATFNISGFSPLNPKLL